MVYRIFKISGFIAFFQLSINSVFAQNYSFIPKSEADYVIVLTENNNSTKGNLYFLKKNESQKTTIIYRDIPVVIGINGSAWGKGLQPDKWNIGTLKKEGDGKSPKGIFKTARAFGYHSMHGIQIPFIESNEKCFCIDDLNSFYYNQIINIDSVNVDWKSHEKMKRNDALYEIGLEIDYNKDPVIKGNGSCIFLHIWRNEKSGTAGCTAMQKENLINIISQLKNEIPCYYVLMNKNEFKTHCQEIGIPEILE